MSPRGDRTEGTTPNLSTNQSKNARVNPHCMVWWKHRRTKGLFSKRNVSGTMVIQCRVFAPRFRLSTTVLDARAGNFNPFPSVCEPCLLHRASPMVTGRVVPRQHGRFRVTRFRCDLLSRFGSDRVCESFVWESEQLQYKSVSRTHTGSLHQPRDIGWPWASKNRIFLPCVRLVRGFELALGFDRHAVRVRTSRSVDLRHRVSESAQTSQRIQCVQT